MCIRGRGEDRMRLCFGSIPLERPSGQPVVDVRWSGAQRRSLDCRETVGRQQPLSGILKLNGLTYMERAKEKGHLI